MSRTLAMPGFCHRPNGDHAVDGGIARAAPDHFTLLAQAGQFKAMLGEPQKGLPCAPQLGNLVENQGYGSFQKPVRPAAGEIAPKHCIAGPVDHRVDMD